MKSAQVQIWQSCESCWNWGTSCIFVHLCTLVHLGNVILCTIYSISGGTQRKQTDHSVLQYNPSTLNNISLRGIWQPDSYLTSSYLIFSVLSDNSFSLKNISLRGIWRTTWFLSFESVQKGNGRLASCTYFPLQCMLHIWRCSFQPRVKLGKIGKSLPHYFPK